MRIVAAAAPAIVLLVFAPHAYAAEPQPGQWKTTMKTQVVGQPARETSRMRCLTPEMAKNPGAAFMNDRDNAAQQNCKRTFNNTASSISWKFECTGEMAMSGTGSMRFDTPTHYTGSVRITGGSAGHVINITTLMEGQRVGDCAK